MIRFYSLLLLIMLVAAAGANASDDITPNIEAGNAVYRARDYVLSYFEPAHGTITGIEGDVVKVKIEGETIVKKGTRFPVFREGDTFYHPVTHEPIGRTESIVGRVEIEGENPDGLYICKTVKGDLTAGDILRIASSKIKLAFFQDKKADWGISEAFYSSLKRSGRFEIVDAYAPEYTGETLSSLAKKLDAEAALMFSTVIKDNNNTLNVKLYWADDAKLFGETEETVSDRTIENFTEEEELITASMTDTGPLGSYKLPGGNILAVGDVDGNGIKELVLSDGINIRIYDYANGLKELWLIEGDPEEKHVAVDVLDLNGNGKSEIFVTSIKDWRDVSALTDDDNAKESRGAGNKGRVSSYVLEYDPSGGYRKIADDLPYFLRASGDSVLMQKFTAKRIYAGPVFKAKWEDGAYLPETPLDLPEGVNIYGFTYVDWQNRGQRQVITFDDSGFLLLYDEGKNLIWRSKDRYGASRREFESRTNSLANPSLQWIVRGRLTVMKTERGQEVVVIRHIPFLKNISGIVTFGIKEAEVYSLWWDGEKMDEKLVLGDVTGAVTDFRTAGNDMFLIARGDFYSLLRNVTAGEFMKGSMLYYYHFASSEAPVTLQREQ